MELPRMTTGTERRKQREPQPNETAQSSDTIIEQCASSLIRRVAKNWQDETRGPNKRPEFD
eukprot:2696220-Karenia_brevis.AAC.1